MSHRSLLIVTSLVLFLAGLIVAAVLVLLPLPTVTGLGVETAWCGPGRTSDGAVQVLLNPSDVNVGSDDQPYDQQVAFEDYCVGQARRRMVEGGVAAVAGGLTGLGLMAIVALTGAGRRDQPVWG